MSSTSDRVAAKSEPRQNRKQHRVGSPACQQRRFARGQLLSARVTKLLARIVE